MCAVGQPRCSISRAQVAASSATRERTVATTGGATEVSPVGQRRVVVEPLDQWCVPRHERGGVHEHDTFTLSVDLEAHLDVIELQAVHGTPPGQLRSIKTGVN